MSKKRLQLRFIIIKIFTLLYVKIMRKHRIINYFLSYSHPDQLSFICQTRYYENNTRKTGFAK